MSEKKKFNNKLFLDSIKVPLVLSGVAALICLLVFSIIAFLYLKTNNKFIIIYLPYGFIAVVSFINAIILQRKTKGRGFLSGIISGSILGILLFVILCTISRFSISSNILIIPLLSIVSGFVGGITSVNI